MGFWIKQEKSNLNQALEKNKDFRFEDQEKILEDLIKTEEKIIIRRFKKNCKGVGSSNYFNKIETLFCNIYSQNGSYN